MENFINRAKQAFLFTIFASLAVMAHTSNIDLVENTKNDILISIKSSVQEAKLYPSPLGLGGNSSQYGTSVAVDGNRAVVSAKGILTNQGRAFVLEHDGTQWNITATLVASDIEDQDQFGKSVAIDGDRIVIGASEKNDSTGAVYIYDFVAGVWQETKLMASDGLEDDRYGSSVSVKNDRVIVGAELGDGLVTNSGAIYIYDLVAGVWQETKISASDGIIFAKFGASVDQSVDRIVVGANGNDTIGFNSGVIYVFDLVGAVWQETKITASDAAAHESFGTSVGILGDRIVVGAPFDDDVFGNSGSVYIYDLVTGVWQETKLTASDAVLSAQFGTSVSLGADRVVVGAIRADGLLPSTGAVYIYDLVTGVWQQSKISASDGAGADDFGKSVSISGDRILIGVPKTDENGIDSGSAYAFDLNGSNWDETKLPGVPGAAKDEFGQSIDVDGDRAVVGASEDDGKGAVYIFDLIAGTWTQTAKIIASDGFNNDQFGFSVSISGDRIIVGAYGDDDKASGAGAVYIYDLVAGNWLETKILANDGVSLDRFGYSVSLSGDRALVGATRHGDGAVYVLDFSGSWFQTKLTASAGSDEFGFSVSLDGDRALIGVDSTILQEVYVFDLVAASWNETVLTPNIASSGFGYSVSLDGDRAVVGADRDGFLVGAAHVYDLVAGVWQETKLIPSDGALRDEFGTSVSVSGDKLLVGAVRKNDYTGAVYAYHLDNGTWIESKLTVNDAAVGDRFGIAVSLQDNRAFVGAFKDDDQGTDSGSVYVLNPFITVGGTVSGLAAGNTIEIENNTIDAMTVGNGSFTFPKIQESGDSYDVKITVQPTIPNQICLVTGGSNNDGTGTITTESVTDIVINCTTVQYDVGVTVTGLDGGNVVLQNNAGDDLTIADNNVLTNFNTAIDDLSIYEVTVLTDPSMPSQTCTVTGGTNADGTGALAGDDDLTITVACTTNQYTVGGAISGLGTGSVTLQNNGGDDLTLNNNDPFTFVTALDDLSLFEVTVLTQPNMPNQTCTITNGDSALAGENYTNVQVTCITDQYTVGGTISGLGAGSVVLQINDGGNLTLNNNDPFTFVTALDDLSAFEVEVLTQPSNPNQICNITAGDSAIAGEHYTDVVVTCVTNQYNIGVTVSGLVSGNFVIVQNNLGDNLAVATNGMLSNFSNQIFDGSFYSITVLGQPTDPDQFCAVDSASMTGFMSGEDVNVAIVCAAPQYFVGGVATGLVSGNPVVLNLGAENLNVDTTTFIFSNPLDDASNYDVSINTEPTSPSQSCTLANQTGQIAAADVDSVEVNCLINQFTVGGNVIGLFNGNSFVVQNNLADDLTITSNSNFVFATALDDLLTFDVTIQAPANNPIQPCVITNDAGSLAGGNVSSVTITCDVGSDLIYINGFETP